MAGFVQIVEFKTPLSLIASSRHGLTMMAILHHAVLGRPWMPELPAPT